jgi:hypothetical protein
VPVELDMKGLETLSADQFAAATAVDRAQWHDEMKLHGELLDGKLAGRAPKELEQRKEELDAAFR